MTGTNPVGAFTQTVSTGGGAQTASQYFANIDSNFAVSQRVTDLFAPRPASTPGMSLVIDPGFVTQTLSSGQSVVTELAAQSVTIGAAPGAPNGRIDLVVVDAGTGVASVIAGSVATSPAAPTLPVGKLKIALVSVPNGTTAIVNANITDVRAVWNSGSPAVPWAIGSGTGDAITAAFKPANTSLVDGLRLSVRAPAANASTAPTFAPDGISAAPITKFGGEALVAGDIAGQYAEIQLRYNLANNRWELENPAISNASLTLTSASIAAALGLTPLGLIDRQMFTSSGTWNKPAKGTFAIIEIWQSGQGGAEYTPASCCNPDFYRPGLGGNIYTFMCLLTDLPSTVGVTIGAGGAASNGNTNNYGSPCMFGSFIVVNGQGSPLPLQGSGLTLLSVGMVSSGANGGGNGVGYTGFYSGSGGAGTTTGNGGNGSAPSGGGGSGSGYGGAGGAGQIKVTVI